MRRLLLIWKAGGCLSRVELTLPARLKMLPLLVLVRQPYFAARTNRASSACLPLPRLLHIRIHIHLPFLITTPHLDTTAHSSSLSRCSEITTTTIPLLCRSCCACLVRRIEFLLTVTVCIARRKDEYSKSSMQVRLLSREALLWE